ncbi:MAG TPA: hypothetical protein VMS74_07315 [Acidimicrobiia bacterium]|nr:hypothetical protein [Acidimicrobiia bacterium]
MSEFLAAAASTMNVPEALVKRSAEARSKAAGASLDEVLEAWAGGAAAPAAAAPPPAASPEPEAVSAPAGAEEEAAPPPEVAAAAPAPAPVAVAVFEEVEDDPVVAVGLRERVRAGGRVGMGFGVVAAIFVMIFSAQWLLARSGSTQSETGDLTFVFSVAAGSFLFGSALLGAFVGGVGAAFVRAVTGWRDAGMRLVASPASSVVIGALAGAVTGVVVGAVVTGSGTADVADETVTQIPLLPTLLWTLFGWIGGGWLIGALVHYFGVPDGLAEAELAEGTTVSRRLGAAFSLPVVSLLTILMVVLPAAWVFIQFPGWAPVIAMFIAGAIITFAGLSAARPGMRISGGEFLVAVGGVAAVVVIVVAVLTTQGAGH